jgi:protein arginine kinase activator
VGKVPPYLSKEARIKIEIRGLKNLLKKHVDKEEYEQAAQIRDKIKKLEGEILSTGGK